MCAEREFCQRGNKYPGIPSLAISVYRTENVALPLLEMLPSVASAWTEYIPVGSLFRGRNVAVATPLELVLPESTREPPFGSTIVNVTATPAAPAPFARTVADTWYCPPLMLLAVTVTLNDEMTLIDPVAVPLELGRIAPAWNVY